ncbi:ral guanine nucleotide dissociation stimulator-like isoform X2 [Equus asinus]|uniref:ral guanine nucleotide dissociation stimulator-like isoform X2 n=1 Tax=Equus asinus TaxID=9793 RepID=UPI0038F7F62D
MPSSPLGHMEAAWPIACGMLEDRTTSQMLSISCWEPGWAKGRIAGSPCGFPVGPCSWPLCTSALVAPTWRAMPTFCQATWSISRPLRLNGKELFKTLVPTHCLGSIWSERDNRERESLAPTVHDTVMHDNTVANCILVTCLGDASMTAQDTARVVELWIRVAEECRALGNFCSLHTILSALQSPAIARLQDTWEQVSSNRSLYAAETNTVPRRSVWDIWEWRPQGTRGEAPSTVPWGPRAQNTPVKSLIQAPGSLDLLGSQTNGTCLQACHSFSCLLACFLSPPCRESSRTWKKWVRREKRVSRELLVQEATSVLKTAERARQGAQERQQQQERGVVPSLVTFFCSLELLDATMEDYVEGNVLNCRKWNEQFKLMEEIELLQEAANLYTVQPDEHFGAWFQAVEPLSEEESYSLSCQLEPRYHWVRKIRLFFKHKKDRSGQNTRPSTKGPVVVVDDPPETS